MKITLLESRRLQKLAGFISEGAWNKQQIDQLLKDLQASKAEMGSMSDAEAFEMAQSMLDDEEGLEQGIKQVYKVTDAAGWLANKM